MSAKQRGEACDRAMQAGAKAFREGKGRDECPFKGGGPWSLRPFWNIGWDQEKAKNASLTVSAGGYPEPQGTRP